MTTHHLLLLPGDGIGTEVMAEAKAVIAWFNARGAGFSRGGSRRRLRPTTPTARRSPTATMAKALAADAVLFGAGRRAEMGQGAL